MDIPESMFRPVPPRLRDMVRRERLEPLGRRILEYQVTTVVAPAGYGKSVWVSSLLDTPQWPDTVWISLDRADADPSVLLHHLIRSAAGPGKDSNALRTLMSLKTMENEWPIAAAAFLDELSRERQLLLVLDDVDFLYGSKAAVDIMEFVLARLPGNIHIVFIARNMPPFKLYRQEIQGQLLKIGSRELLFQEDEACELFSGMKLRLSDKDVSVLYAVTEGWAVGLRLLGIYLLQPGSSPKEALRSIQNENSSFYQYFINEFLGTMPVDIQKFLMDASCLPYLEPGLCDAALARSDSESILAVLHRYGLLSPFIEEKAGWRLHHLVREWLMDISSRQCADFHFSIIRERAAVYFEHNGDVNRSIEQYYLSDRLDKVALMIHRHGYRCFKSGFRMDTLYAWIEKLPAELVENDCWLLWLKGMGMIHVDDLGAFRILSAAADLAEKEHELKCEAVAIFMMLLSATASGNLDLCESAGRRLQSRGELMDNAESHAEALASALQYAMASDSLQQGIGLSHKALQLDLPPEMCMWVRYTTGYFLLREGRLHEARQLIEQTLSIPYVAENERRLAVGYETLVDIAFIMGDFGALDKVGLICTDLGKKYRMYGIVGRVQYLQALRHYRENDYAAARQTLDQAYENLSSTGIVHFANQAACDMLLLRIINGENSKELLQQLLDMQVRFDRVPYGLSIDYVVNTNCGIAAMEIGNLELAGRLLEKSSRHWHEIGSRINMAGTNLLLARLRQLQGKEEACDSLLREALCEAEAWQWEHFWEWHPSTVQAMCQRAIDRGIHPHWAARILKRWYPAQSRREFSLLLTSPKQQLRWLASNCFLPDCLAAGKAVLSVFFLGGFRLFVNGIEIAKSSWKTQKAADLFKHIVTCRTALDKEYLMQQLWPDGGPGSNDGKLRMTLSYVRKALATAGLPSGCVAMRRGEILLESGYEVYCDYTVFTEKARSALQYAQANHPFAIPALEQAARAYTGEFLPEDLYSDFATDLRNELRNLYLEVLAQLARLQFGRGDRNAALQTCHRYLALEPVDETVVRMAMIILSQTKKKHKAMELFRTLAETLAREYSTVPDKETAALYHRIQGGAVS